MVLSLLAGCASVGPRDATRPVEPSNPLTGRMSVRIDGPSPRAVSAVFDLKGDAMAGSLGLSTPLGSMLAQAAWSPGRVTLTTPKGQSDYPDLDTLTRDVLGEAVPVAAMFDWLRARPWPGAPSRPIADETLRQLRGNSAMASTASSAGKGFEQLGWTVQLGRFDEGFVDAFRLQSPPVTVRVRLD